MKTPKISPKRKLKPLRLFAWPAHIREGIIVYCHMDKTGNDRESMVPVAVIPLDDQGALIAKATAAFLAEDRKPESWLLDDCMTAALVAIGVLPKQRKKGRK